MSSERERPAVAIAAYISGHGFGHYIRSEAVLARLAAGGAVVHVRTDRLALGLARRASWAASVTEIDTGAGLVQRGPFEPDLAATAAAAQSHLARWDDLVACEADALRSLSVRAVYADVPPVAFAIAARARVPSIALANFAWSWIYERAASEAVDEAAVPGASVEVIAQARRPRNEAERAGGIIGGAAGALLEASRAFAHAEALATRLLVLPFSGGIGSFTRPEPIAMIARTPTRSRAEAHALLPAPASDARPCVLLSFGGFGATLDLAQAAARNPRFAFVAFARSDGPLPENVRLLPHDHGLPHQDLVLGADAVIGKLGYGTVSEAIAARAPLVHGARGLPGEYPFLADAVARHLPSAPLALDDLLAGRWTEALDRVLGARADPREAPPPLGGEARAAAAVLEAARETSPAGGRSLGTGPHIN